VNYDNSLVVTIWRHLLAATHL